MKRRELNENTCAGLYLVLPAPERARFLQKECACRAWVGAASGGEQGVALGGGAAGEAGVWNSSSQVDAGPATASSVRLSSNSSWR